MERRIAYFSMEIGFNPAVPTYSGGLGVLAGDTIRSAADLGLPMVAVVPLHRKGYFVQELDGEGNQHERPSPWNVEDFLEQLSPIVLIELERRKVLVRAWRYWVKGSSGSTVPIFLLDTDLPENHPEDRKLSDHLYGGDSHYRLCQEAVLGIAGVRMLRALGFRAIERFHMNEGHAALLTLELLNEQIVLRGGAAGDGGSYRTGAGPGGLTMEDVAAVRAKCVFTTHTPVPAGHDRFPIEMVDQVLGRQDVLRTHTNSLQDHHLNMTYLALNLSHYVNAVAMRHADVSQRMFPDYTIDWITNGVHAQTWTTPPFAQLFDRYIPSWRQDNFALRNAMGIPGRDIWDAHMRAKAALMEYINQWGGWGGSDAAFDPNIFTLGFARRAATYKRADLLVSDVAALNSIADRHGPMQIVYAGKSHPRDGGGKDAIRRVHQMRQALLPKIKLVYLPNYDMTLGQLITAGIDVWVNTPQRPLEASGTSGMKSALNAVPSLSIPDGWWVEGCIEGVTGWSIGEDRAPDPNHDWQRDAADLYHKLDQVVLPTFHGTGARQENFVQIMRQSIAINGSYFNTQRMVQDYAVKAYLC